ncbi:NADPH-dependent FMN reductase [Micromonospora sp. CPCC 205561]|uniref:NADPH-dependent FMN reductase n=1 Tax=Micromonospora sp. CPCC 205561 TaxID=3122407 RepID=UPI003FA57B64
MERIRIGIVVGSTRPGRRGRAVADWVHEAARERHPAVAFELLDLADFDLPLLDEPRPAVFGDFAGERLVPAPHQEQVLGATLGELLTWTAALALVRRAASEPAHPVTGPARPTSDPAGPAPGAAHPPAGAGRPAGHRS